MKNLITCTVLILSLSFAASAQTAGSKSTEDQKKEMRAKMEAFETELKLTAEQQPKFEEINSQFFEEMAKLKAVTKDRNEKMKDLLTAEQYKVFQAHQKEMKDELKSMRSQ